jgi:tetraacyldisaccharide 4'-kinase
LIFIFVRALPIAALGKVTMSVARLLLLPFSWLYGAVLWLRHLLYDTGALRSEEPSIPTIAIGNLALGGTGKTPMLELLLRILKQEAPIATLSRGYGRKGSELREVREGATAEEVGDEPLQVKWNFPGVRVYVGADRVKAIAAIRERIPGLLAVLLDDALQHRRLTPTLAILLTTYQRPWCDDHLVPAGRLRDLPLRRKAAHIVLVSKCPYMPSSGEQVEWRRRLGLRNDQELFFSGIAYSEPKSMPPSISNALLFTGIADPAPLAAHTKRLFAHTEHMAFPDHHAFTHSDLAQLAARFDTFAAGPKVLITTEKDAARLRSVIAGSPLEGLPLATIGMRAVILNEPERFATLIRDHVATHPAHR